eukprot:CAMPEP_0171109262 /NCGR_PEP_ID=MMETSP0766_2-20121228/70655_1 /TAXON_ID=439317 /ORGANISM="Gambierdiscus australes, Strain CAWD 149" /LENGTH=71 /DNA_ID=CAMNT_0011570981 /DNA_START=87 /DNA_END=299 /DNA_ORIENTATION=+
MSQLWHPGQSSVHDGLEVPALAAVARGGQLETARASHAAPGAQLAVGVGTHVRSMHDAHAGHRHAAARIPP